MIKKMHGLVTSHPWVETLTHKTQKKIKRLLVIWHASSSMESWEQSEGTDNLDASITRHIRRVLSKTKGKVKGPDEAAAFLGINLSTLRNGVKKIGIDHGRNLNLEQSIYER